MAGGRENMKTWERLSITLMLCLTILAAVWLHGILTRYVAVPASNDPFEVTRYDRITGRVWVIVDRDQPFELGVKR